MTEEIKCQAPHSETGGCFTCGGYGVVLFHNVVCNKCKKRGWQRPGVHTSYVGKEYWTYDGVRLIVQAGGGAWCSDCEEAKP